MQKYQPEPWLRGTHSEIPVVPRSVLHALELAQEDLTFWCAELSEPELMATPWGLPPIAFHLRHIARSLDRLLTYAQGRALTEEQLADLRSELEPGATHDILFAELRKALGKSGERVRALATVDLQEPRTVGKKDLPTTVGGIVGHAA